MGEADKIQGKDVITLLEEVKQKQIMLSIELVDQGYEQTTMIIRIPEDPDASFFVIDPPQDFMNYVSKIKESEFQFRFRGLDNLDHIFTSLGGTFSDNEIRIKFPDYIDRFQRRRYFRLRVPTGTKFLFRFGQVRQEMSMINISMRGAFGVLELSKGENQEKPIYKKKDLVEDIEIISPAGPKISEQKISVKKAVIRRAEHEPRKNIDLYAFEFMSIDRDQEKRLNKFIFDLQRLALQKK
jgi:PilZ domain